MTRPQSARAEPRPGRNWSLRNRPDRPSSGPDRTHTHLQFSARPSATRWAGSTRSAPAADCSSVTTRHRPAPGAEKPCPPDGPRGPTAATETDPPPSTTCLLYTSDAADEEDS